MRADLNATTVILSLVLGANPAAACSLATADLFDPVREKFVEHFVSEDFPERLPAPIVEAVESTRGKAEPGFSCDDAGILKVALSLPGSSGYKLSEVGFYFRVVSGRLPDLIFPPVPVVGPIQNNRMEIILAWLDGHPRDQKPLKARVEVFALAHDLSIGPPTEFDLKAPVGKVGGD